jgi:putative membrane protein
VIHADQRFHEAVAAKVAELERATDAEIVVVSATRSGTYRDQALVLAAVAALAAFLVLLALPWAVHPLLAVADLVAVWGVTAWLASGHPVSARLAREARRRDQVRQAAAAEFHLEAVHATPRRTGLLVYLSAWEREVELIPDVGLEARIPRGELGAAAAKVSPEDLDGFLAGLHAVGLVLAAHVPATEERTVELADAPRVR